MSAARNSDRHATDRLPVQMRGEASAFWRKKLHGGSIPASVGEAAWQGYDADGHGSQTCALIHDRGGFGLAELGYYIARAVDEGRVTICVTTPKTPSEQP